MRIRILWFFALFAFLIAIGLSTSGSHAFADESNALAAGEFSVVLMPDTQYYAQKYPQTYIAQTEWIKNNRGPLDIRFVIHLGDIVQNFDAENEWRAADRAHRILDGVAPYSVLPGNHDVRGGDATLYNTYFPPGRFWVNDWYGGHEGQTNENNYCTFEASGMKFLVLSLGYAPDRAAIDWADKVLDEQADRRAIVATHSYLNTKGRNAQGWQIWNTLARKHENVFLVVCGHIAKTNLIEATGDAGQKVYEMLVDYQKEPNGGDGWLRILRFSPEENKIYVRDYSPTLGRYRDGEAANFSLDYRMSATANK